MPLAFLSYAVKYDLLKENNFLKYTTCGQLQLVWNIHKAHLKKNTLLNRNFVLAG